MYCQAGDNPVVKYSFSQGDKIFKSAVSPIDVNIRQLPDMAVCDQLRVTATTVFNTQPPSVVQSNVYAPITGIKIAIEDNLERASLICGGNIGGVACVPNGGIPISVGSILLAVGRIINSYVSNIEILNKPNVPRYQIEISDIGGNIIFKDSGLGVPTFSVQCGNCPDGQEEHKTSIYPGYCCLNCQSIANEIRGITNIVRKVNNG